MLKKFTSPPAVGALLLLAGATAIPTALACRVAGDEAAPLFEDTFHLGVGTFTLGTVWVVVMLIFKIWKWHHFARIKAIGKWWLLLLMNIATLALFPAAVLHLHIIGQMHPDIFMHNDAPGLALMGAWNLALFTLIATNILYLVALPHTTLPAQMAMRCKRQSKELNMWRIILAVLLIIDLCFLAIAINIGAVMGVVAATVYMYVIFALHAGKIAWKEGLR